MPVWLAILFGAIPGTFGLVAVIWRVGAMHNEVKNIIARIEPIPQMASDIAYLKGIEDGKKAAATQALIEHMAPPERTRRPRVAAVG